MKQITYVADDAKRGMTGEEMADNLRDAEQVQKLAQPITVRVRVGWHGNVTQMTLTGHLDKP